ncbi:MULTISPECIES: type I-E CRISPR-associated protein Cas6/Cse3/CasE [Rhodomicrobium]|uniref:type I-E CRISPR-associated protein Cas6/Cse3/CasE n=1 Tax=Rhodomicrobium TaxID=1068 RepID=UPI000B4BA47F|nr:MULTISPECIES: type I-E CRISPR-associated protein Cas6/Cse3/CasE [Rhodomicrobium]
MTQLFLSKARLKSAQGEALSAIAPLLLPQGRDRQVGHAHRILWLLFQNDADTTRDFLWRDEGRGIYLILSRRQPTDPHGLFELETSSFEPNLAVGDTLRFVLRANAIVASKSALGEDEEAARRRGKRVDIVMHVLYDMPRSERAVQRERVVVEEGRKWLAGQGSRAGFEVCRPAGVSGYRQVAIERRNGRPAGFSVLDFEGEIRLTDPAAFMARLAIGFGSAKAFGNGLMLIRRL